MKQNYFIPENKTDAREELSLSGRYKLVISSFKTKDGCWNYSQGEVYRNSDNKLLGTVQRNYSAFPFLFIEDHPRGDFLICGENYQGQTVIDLINEKRKDFLPSTASKGTGFCWASYTYEPINQMLIVDGCYWACPYETKFFDFSDPMEKGWDVLTDEYIDNDVRKPEIYADGTIECYETENGYDYEPEEGHKLEDFDILVIKTFKKENDKLVLVREWVSEKERTNRIKRAESEAKWNKWQEEFYNSDPLYLAMVKCLEQPRFKTKSSYMSFGLTYKDWCPHFDGRETRACKRIAERQNDYTIDLDWGVETAPIKLTLFKGGKSAGEQYFDHSVDGMLKAFEYATKTLQ